MSARRLILAASLLGAPPSLAQNMALTPPLAREAVAARSDDGFALSPRSSAHVQAVAHVEGGELPNQKTGPARPQRVVRDICVGCDR